MTGLTYIVELDDTAQIVVQQIAADCCACAEELDPDGIVGHAARHVAEAAFETFTDWQSRHAGPVYLRFPWRGRNDPPWPAVRKPRSSDAPKISVAKVSELPEEKDI